ncbi:hypothetical protein BS47DRAFT_1369804 [Hydnum rufescens UP504]|uniref:Uncharacterized protein n=1 Tax=Hydnum rufescens UP504 TaxID=1448309 RepID=A0A9P6ACI5_9AGAM|nr:hypothetical protein BS47DRAFT_1369804 [Hydnum rufescens UP504]
MNAVAMSTKEMGEGSTHDALNNFWGDWNYHKILGIDRPTSADETQTGLPPESVTQWEAMIEIWNHDWTKPNPYEFSVSNMTQADIHKELIEVEHVSILNGELPIHATSASSFLAVGFEIEDAQHHLLKEVEAWKTSCTNIQSTNIQEHRLALLKCIQSFHLVQRAYMPEAYAFATSKDEEHDALVHVESIVLYLPSQLPPSLHHGLTATSLAQMEGKLRFPQACDTLVELRQSLSVHAHLAKFKCTEVCGQRPNTHAQGLLDRAQFRMDAIADKYHHVQEAHKTLLGLGNWEHHLQVLKDSDICALSDPDATTGEGFRTLSWIWVSQGVGDNPDVEMHEALRVEWAKSHARKDRWCKEVLLEEEMCWVIAFWGGLPLDILEGVRSYALHQATLQCDRATHLRLIWVPFTTLGSDPKDLELPDQNIPYPEGVNVGDVNNKGPRTDVNDDYDSSGGVFDF